jgi:hypothetical protein
MLEVMYACYLACTPARSRVHLLVGVSACLESDLHSGSHARTLVDIYTHSGRHSTHAAMCERMYVC